MLFEGNNFEAHAAKKSLQKLNTKYQPTDEKKQIFSWILGVSFLLIKQNLTGAFNNVCKSKSKSSLEICGTN